MSAADPFAVLGVRPDASPDEVVASYRRLAKRWHPDRAQGRDAERRMAQINAAYDALRPQLELGGEDDAGAGTAAPRRPARPPGWWLPEATRRSLGLELLAALAPREPVELFTPTTTWDGQALLVLTDRRLLWLLDEAVGGRVRSLRRSDVLAVEVRQGWPRGPRKTVLRIRRRGGRRSSFGDLEPTVAQQLAAALGGAA